MTQMTMKTPGAAYTMTFESKMHRINYLFKENREVLDDVKKELRRVQENEWEIQRLLKEVVVDAHKQN